MDLLKKIKEKFISEMKLFNKHLNFVAYIKNVVP